MTNNFEDFFAKLQKSPFRSKFHLSVKDKDYVASKGWDVIKKHAEDFVEKRLAILQDNDGKQTPFRGHPVFVAQHACACCCRGCLEKWHKIPKNKVLTNFEKEYIVNLLLAWIKRECEE